MGRYVFKLPDVGEGTAEAEIVAWHVKVGDAVGEDQNLVDVMTDKATVEMTSPVSGKVLSIHGEPGQMAAVGSPLVELEVEGEGNVKPGAAPAAKAEAPKPAAKPEPKPEGAEAQRLPRSCLCIARSTLSARCARSLRTPCANRATSRWHRRRCASARMNLGSRCNTSPDRDRRDASPIRISTTTSHPADATRLPHAPAATRNATASKTSRSSACAARSRRRCRTPSAASPISPMSRKST